MASHNQRTSTKLSRRGFMKAGAAASALAVPYVVPARVFGKDAPSNRITLGCIGMGNQGIPIMQRFLRNDDCQVLAVCDVNRGSYGYKEEDDFYGREPALQMVEEYYARRKASGNFQGCAAYNDFREILAREDIDAVTVCAPDHWHAVMTIMAAEAGKDIYCEKPLSLTIGQGQEMVKAVRRHQRILQTGSHERANPLVRQACELVRRGYIGEVKHVITHVGENNKVGPGPGWQPMPVPEGFDYDMWLGPAPEAPYHKDRCLYRFRFNYDYSGGQVTNFGAHSNDMAQWGLGMDSKGPVEVEYIDAKYLPEGSLFNTATHTKFRCRYPQGTELICQTDKPSVRCVFEGTEGRVQVDNKGQNFETTPATLASIELEDAMHRYRDVANPHQRNFLDCVKSREDPIAPVEVGHRSISVCHLGNIAIQLKANLQWDPQAERFPDNAQANALLHRELRDPWALETLVAAMRENAARY